MILKKLRSLANYVSNEIEWDVERLKELKNRTMERDRGDFNEELERISNRIKKCAIIYDA